MRYGLGSLLTSDGCVANIASLTSNVCCPITPCNVDPCALTCSFIELLPNGPLWDRAKAYGRELYSGGTCNPSCPSDLASCATLVDYAVYSAQQLTLLIKGPLWDAMRESSTYTAVETLNDWLDQYGWQDCWDSVCRDRRLGPSPFECADQPDLDSCDANFDPIYVPPLPERLDLAVRRGTAIALKRLQMEPIKNLCGINWVIEPLGAVLRPRSTPLAACCKGHQWEICNIGTTLDAPNGTSCDAEDRMLPVTAYVDVPDLDFDASTGHCIPTGPGTFRVWPGVMAAQCIALSLLPKNGCDTPIIRCTDLES